MSDPGAVFTQRSGVVEQFDDHAGLGTVRDGSSSATWSFHATRIADGSRTIAIGTPVTFLVVPGPTGVEAVSVARWSPDEGPSPA